MTRGLRLIALAGALLAACTSPEQRFAEHMRRADAYLEQGHEDDALIELQGALKLEPNDADVNERLGKLLADRGEAQQAVFYLGEAVRLDPERVDAAMRQASLVWSASPKRAARIIRRVQKRHPDDPRVYRTLSGLALVRNDTEAAKKAAARAIKLDPNDPENWVQLGAAHVARIRQTHARGETPDDALYEEAIAAFDKADSLYGGHVGAWIEKARIYGSWRGHGKQAAEAFRHAIALAKDQHNQRHQLVAAMAMEDYARAARRGSLRIEALREVVAAQPSRVQAWERLAELEERAKGAAAGDAVFAELLKKQDGLAAAHIAYANYLSRHGRADDAVAHLQSTIAKNGESEELLEQLVLFQLGMGKQADARATYNRLVAGFEGSDGAKRSAARLALAEGKPDEALEALRDFAGGRESAETERLRAAALLRKGDLAGAQAAADRAIALAPAYVAPVLRLKAQIHAKAKEWKPLLATLRDLESHGAELTAADQLLRARALYETGEGDRGRALLEKLLAKPGAQPAVALEYATREGARNPEKALAQVTKALRYAPGSFDLLEAATRLDMRTGKFKRALRRLDRVVESQLAGPRVLLLRAELLAKSGKLEPAEADALRAFEAAPELPGAVDLLFAIYQAEGKLAEAQRSFEEAEKVGVLHAGARVLLGRLYLAQGQVDKARAMYEKVIAENPEIAPAKNDLAYLLAQQGTELERALGLAEEAQRALPEHPAAADTVGYVYHRMGRNEAALQQFRLALSLADSHPGADGGKPLYNYHMGLALAALGRAPEAAKAFETALALDPSFPGADDARRQLESARAVAAAPKG